ACAALDPQALARDVSALVSVPSVTGEELSALRAAQSIASRLDLSSEIEAYDLDRIRHLPGYPGEVASRDHLYGLVVTLPGINSAAERFLLNGHIDVVPPGPRKWSFDPWSGAISNGRVLGRGSVDMKGGVVAALHAMAAVNRAPGARSGDVVMQIVASE